MSPRTPMSGCIGLPLRLPIVDSHQFAQAAGSGNNDQVNAALTTLNQACQACHMAFRGPPPQAN